MTISLNCFLELASSSGSRSTIRERQGNKICGNWQMRAWYPLFAHALNFVEFQASTIFLVDGRVIIASSLPRVFASMEDCDFQSVLTYVVSNIEHPGLSLKPEQIAANIHTVYCGKDAVSSQAGILSPRSPGI